MPPQPDSPPPGPVSAVEMRQRMPSAARWAYLDHAAVAPLPAVARDAMREWVTDVADNGATDWGRWRREVETLRRSAASMLSADVDGVAVVRNTTEGIGLVAEGLDWQPGDNLVVPGCEFPSNLYAWQHLERRGVEVRVVPTTLDQIDYDSIDAACDHRTRLVTSSWIGFRTGFRIDPARMAHIAHSHDAIYFLDAIQGLGAFPLDVEATGVDALAADGHKWLLGPEGAGLLYLRPSLLDRLRPLGIGWNSVTHAGDFSNTALDLKPTAGRYEGGTYNMVGIAGLSASVQWMMSLGIGAIRDLVLANAAHLADRLESAGARVASCRQPDHLSGIVSFEWPGHSPTTLQRTCQSEGVVINSRDGRLRASPHAYSNTDDCDRLLEILAAHPPG